MEIESMGEDALMQTIKKALSDLEERGDIVLCPEVPGIVEKHVFDAVRTLLPNAQLTTEELLGLRSLILHAIADERFFDWEMPTLIGFRAEELKNSGEVT
ncbi:hypothetical protein G6L46_24390 [Agrobacterium rhizogenes]|uniref:hypothetical protein n=1 Tax=Rhizobium rhizogenes TaxID=359 RepID=UPI0015746923|nr:hypothetical protein [Rhizobium rhizogenes]NTF90292.1 hypothetical protein [Rhizobium rhizogenes]